MLRHPKTAPKAMVGQRGMMLIESLVAILLIVLGIMGIAGLTARSLTSTGQAHYRTEAGLYAAQIVHNISLKVDRSSPEALAASLQQFKHQTTGDSALCSFSGAGTDNADLGNILSAVRGLPGAVEAHQQILVDTSTGLNQVTVTLCWEAQANTGLRNYQLQAYIH